jgi:ABC-type multidrug transport system ATPase subunit
MTAILSSTEAELRTIALLLSGRQTTGSFDGEITIKGSKNDGVTSSVGFVSRVRMSLCSVSYSIAYEIECLTCFSQIAKSLYIPGLTYEEMLSYAARLRVPGSYLKSGGSKSISKRVEEVLDMLDLKRCRHRAIPERPSSRGEIGGELRRLVVAIELIDLPKVLVLDDPARNLDPSVALHLFTQLKGVADNGYTIIFTVPTASQQIYRLFNKIVLLSQGYSIYAGDPLQIKEYFTSSELSYRFAEDRNPIDFLLDVSSGIERPRGQREALPSDALQRLFEASSYYDDGPNSSNPILSPVPVTNEVTFSLLPKTHVPMYGYKFDGVYAAVMRSLVITERALFVKLKEREVLKKTFLSSTFLGLFIGYFAYNTGNLGDYCLSLVRFPYPDTVNTSAILFLNSAFIMIQQVLNVHIICQKLRVFRDEQKAGVSPYAGFWFATLVSEAIVAVFFTLLFCTTVYFLAALGDAESMPFYLGVQILNTCIGVGTTVMLAAIFNSEVVVRDIFLVFTFLMLFLAGYIFTLPTIRSDMKDISQINPLRWVFEALMVWKFEDIVDGPIFLETYGFENFKKDNVFEILTNFIIFSGALFFLALIPGPNLLHREPRRSDRFSTASVDSELMTEDRKSIPADSLPHAMPRKSSKRSLTPAAPVLFLKEPSITGKRSTITSQTSRTGTGHVETRGPTVIFRRLTYRVRDKGSIFGYKDILHSVSGQFDWGKLGVIMGSVHSGKSTLLQVLGGVPVSQSTKLSGSVMLNDAPYDRTLQPWQRSAYVGNLDQHIRDITTKEIITYAMKLRCASAEEFPRIEENVKNAIELLSLNE